MSLGPVRRLLLLLVLVFPMNAAAASAECLKAGADNQVTEGKLISARITVEAYRRTQQAYLLQLPTPACLDGPDDIDKVKRSERIHLFATDEKLNRRIRGLVGKTVRVRGVAFGEHTAHHHAPIVMRLEGIDPL
jgi:hypothetical protein